MKNFILLINHIKNNKRIYGSLFIFTAIFCILGLPFTSWGFKTDDWGNIYHCTTRNLVNFLGFFQEESIGVLSHASNLTQCEQSFFSGSYRPVSFIYYAIQHIFFDNNPYGYFLVNIAIHAITAVILFNWFTTFTSYLMAIFAATYFGFHPSLWNWLGWISAQPYSIELLIFFISLSLLKRFIDYKQWLAYIFSCVLFLSNLFLHEQTFFLPLWIIFAVIIYKKTIIKQKSNFFSCFFYGLLISLGYWVVSIFYFTVRLHQLPLTANTATLTFQPTWQSFINRMSQRTLDFISYAADMYGLSFMPNNHQIIKGLLMAGITLGIFFLFFKNKQKVVVFFLVCSVLLFSWPALLMHCQQRYSYMALPFFITLILILFPKNLPFCKIRYVIYLFFSLLIINNANFLYKHFRQQEKILHHVLITFKKLVQNPTTKDRSLCFFSLPTPLISTGIAQAIWLLRGNNKQPVFQYDCLLKKSDFYPQYRIFNPLFITWDYKKSDFLILKKWSPQ